MLAEQGVVLEQEAMPSVWIQDEMGIGQLLRQHVCVDGRNNQIMTSACDEHWVRDVVQAWVRCTVTVVPAR